MFCLVNGDAYDILFFLLFLLFYSLLFTSFLCLILHSLSDICMVLFACLPVVVCCILVYYVCCVLAWWQTSFPLGINKVHPVLSYPIFKIAKTKTQMKHTDVFLCHRAVICLWVTTMDVRPCISPPVRAI